MTYLLVRHKVTDFTHWKRVFDSNRAAQEKAGLRIDEVLGNVVSRVPINGGGAAGDLMVPAAALRGKKL